MNKSSSDKHDENHITADDIRLIRKYNENYGESKNPIEVQVDYGVDISVDQTLDLITKNAKLLAGIRFAMEWTNDKTLTEILQRVLKETE
jgi:hypothetical protein